MLTAFLIAIIVLLTLALGASLYYLWKFAKIIMVFEDDISDTMTALSDVETSIESMLEMPMFFDSPEVREAVEKVLEEVKLCRGTIIHLIQRFTERSKQQYYFTDRYESRYEAEQPATPTLPGQPPGTPNPLQMIKNEGVVLGTEHQRNQNTGG